MTALGKNEDFTGDPALDKYDSKIKCVVSYYPLTTFLNPAVLKNSNFEDPKRFIPMFGGLLKDKIELATLTSPVEYLDNSNPPILLIHGDNDNILSIENSLYMKEVSQKKGAGVELVVVKGAGHGFRGDNIYPSVAQVNKIAAEFIFKNL